MASLNHWSPDVLEHFPSLSSLPDPVCLSSLSHLGHQYFQHPFQMAAIISLVEVRYSGTSELRTHWDQVYCPLYGGSDILVSRLSLFWRVWFNSCEHAQQCYQIQGIVPRLRELLWCLGTRIA